MSKICDCYQCGGKGSDIFCLNDGSEIYQYDAQSRSRFLLAMLIITLIILFFI